MKQPILELTELVMIIKMLIVTLNLVYPLVKIVKMKLNVFLVYLVNLKKILLIVVVNLDILLID